METLPGTQTGALPGPGDLVRNLCGRFAETLCRDIFSLAKSREQELSRGEMKFSGEEQKAEADFARRLKATEAMKKKNASDPILRKGERRRYFRVFRGVWPKTRIRPMQL